MTLLYRKNLFKFLFWFWLILIFVSSFLPKVTPPEQQISKLTIRLDYIIHFLVFLILAFFLIIWRMTNNYDYSFLTLIRMVLIGIVFAFISEFPQKFISYRTFNIIDFIYNSTGFCFGFVLTGLFFKRYFLAMKKINK